MIAPLQPAAPDMHPGGWKPRVQLAACYRVFDPLGWTVMARGTVGQLT